MPNIFSCVPIAISGPVAIHLKLGNKASDLAITEEGYASVVNVMQHVLGAMGSIHERQRT